MNQAPTKDESCPYSKSLTKGVFDESNAYRLNGFRLITMK